MIECDVAIVGYGPVGQALAILLGERGWRVAVFEKQPSAYPLPRAVHFDHEVARILQATRVIDELAPSTEPADFYEWRNASGAVLLRFASRAAGRSGWPEANMFAQPDLERLLDRRARSLPRVSVQRAAEVTGVEAGAASVRLRVRTESDPALEVAARFAVGCDGANSTVRPHLGASVTDLGFFFDWLIVDVLPHEPRTWSPLNVQVCDPARPTTLVSGGRGRRRWEFMRLPEESVEDLNREKTAWRLLEPWGVTPANATLERHAVYRFQARWVDRWRSGRLLLAGDAAHQMPPFAGQGLCSGLRDAVNLAWKLDLVLAGRSPDALLDTYASERVPQVRGMVDFSMALGRVICIADPAEAAARDAAMTASARQETGTTPPLLGIGPGALRADDRHAGQLFVQGRVRHDGTTGLFDDVTGRGFRLLSMGGDPAAHLDAASAAWLREIGGRAIGIVSEDEAAARASGNAAAHSDAARSDAPRSDAAGVANEAVVVDVDGTYARWFAEAGAQVVLQRPDFYVYGAAQERTGAHALLADLRATLSCGRAARA